MSCAGLDRLGRGGMVNRFAQLAAVALHTSGSKRAKGVSLNGLMAVRWTYNVQISRRGWGHAKVIELATLSCASLHAALCLCLVSLLPRFLLCFCFTEKPITKRKQEKKRRKEA